MRISVLCLFCMIFLLALSGLSAEIEFGSIWEADVETDLFLGGSCLKVDSAGYLYVTGVLAGKARVGSTTLISAGELDVFICKLDSRGNFIWAQRAGGKYRDEGTDLAVDNAGNVYVTGKFKGLAKFGSTSLQSAGERDIFICKLDAKGNFLWAKQAGGSFWDEGNGIGVDDAGNCYVTGFFWEKANFGNTTLVGSGGFDIFICKLDKEGNFLWSKQAGGPDHDYGKSIAVDAAGNHYVTGSFQSNADFGDLLLTSKGEDDIFVGKYDNNGNLIWLRRIGDLFHHEGRKIYIDGKGNCYVYGGYDEDDYYYCWNVFIWKLDSNGTTSWIQHVDGARFGKSDGMAVDRNGNVYITGWFEGEPYFGEFSLRCGGNYVPAFFIAKLSEEGNFIWAGQGPDVSFGGDIAVDHADNLYFMGYFGLVSKLRVSSN